MATSSQAAPATTAAVIGSSTMSTTSETIVGSHIFKIDGFSATKDLGVGESIKSSTFRVGGYGWYIECYPCGDADGMAGWVSLFLCRQDDHPAGSEASGECQFTLIESLKDSCFSTMDVGFEDDDWREGMDFIKRKELESLLKDDCFQVRCVLLIEKFPVVPRPDLATETLSGSHVLTVDGYSKTRGAHAVREAIVSSSFYVGGHSWWLWFYPCGEGKNNEAHGLTTYLCVETDGNNEVKVRFEMTLLTLAGLMISSIQDFCTFSDTNNAFRCTFLTRTMQHECSPLLQDGIQIRCDVAVVKGITVVPPPNQHQGFGDLLASQLGTDVRFEVGGDLFSAHKCVLATRSTAFMAEFFGPAGKENAGVTKLLRIDDMEPRVFKALLHFIYTDTLPEIDEVDKVAMAQGLLVAADRYAMERLKLICADMLCCYVDATTAVATKELAEKHGCLKLKEGCIKVIRDWLAKVAPDPNNREEALDGVLELPHGPVW